jgi:hypothetical protein
MTSTVSTAGAGALMAFAALLCGCDQQASAASGGLKLSGSAYCAPFKANAGASASGALSTALTDPAAAFDDCIHRWGYTLAPARDPADVVAQAAVDACGPIIGAWNQQAGNQQAEAQPTGYRSRRQSQPPPSPMAQQIRMSESRALFYVVQARAAGCAPPPANTLFAANGPTG